MRKHVQRLARAAALGLLAYVASAWFYKRGHTTLGLWLGGAVVLLALCIGVFSALRLVRARREQRWEAAIFRPALRPKAVGQLQKRIARLTPVAHRPCEL